MTADTQSTQPPVQEAQKTDKEINFEKLRKQLDQERAEKQEYMRRIQELESARTKYAAPVQDDDEESDEPYVDHKALNKKMAKWESRLEEKIEQKAEAKARALLEQEKQQNYLKQNPDFYQMLSEDKIQQFANEHPSIAEKMLRMPDNFDRQALLYEQMKMWSSTKAKANEPTIQQKIDQNRRSPFYQPTGIGTAPYNTSGDFSPAGQKNSYQKMQELKSKLRL